MPETHRSPIDAETECDDFFEPRPPLWAVRSLATLLIALFGVALLGSLTLKVPETVEAPFELLPEHGASPLRAPREGRVSEVRVHEGQDVESGQTLFVLRSESVGERSASLASHEAERRSAREQAEIERQRYASARAGLEERSRHLERRRADLEGMVEIQRRELEIARGVLARYAALREKDLLSETDHAAREMQVRESELELERLESELAEVPAELSRLRRELEVEEADHRSTLRGLDERIERATVRIRALGRDADRRSEDALALAAPCTGTLLRLQVKQGGAFVEPGEALAEIACGGDPLLAELLLPQNAVGRVQAEQGVKLLYDAFPYQRFGVRHAWVRWVSPASVEIEGQPVFRALAELGEDHIRVDGAQRPLRAGMHGRARVVVGRRTLVTYVFEPLQRLRESLRDVPLREAALDGPDARRAGPHSGSPQAS